MPANESFHKIPNPYSPYDQKKGRYFYNKAVTKLIKREFEIVPPRKMIFIQGSEGSGKSSTLDRIINEPDTLGAQYFPLYIPCTRIKTGKNDDFLLTLYEHIRKSIDTLGIRSFEDPVDNIKTKVNASDFSHLFTYIEQNVEKTHSIILLILDDFDKFIEFKILKDRHIKVILLFKEFLEKNSNIRIIMTGRLDFSEMIKQWGFGDFLKNTLTIKMKSLEIEEFNEAVTEPVKNWVTYTGEALEAIRTITGGNMYCQQLLCYYIIFHLNIKQKTVCDAEDVEAAAGLTINDERDDFKYFWDKLIIEEQLGCSAIMDDSIVKKRGYYHFIDQSSLLYHVFEPEALNRILNRLHSYDFINKVEGRRFEDSPFKIPLYGNWIKKEHPFIKTVVENFDFIAHSTQFSSLETILGEISKEMFPHDRQDIIHFIQEWFELKNKLYEYGRLNRDEIEIPLRVLCRVLNLFIKDNDSPQMDYFTIDSRKLNIGRIEEAFFIIQDRNDPDKDDIKHLKDMILSNVNTTKPCLFFCLKKNDLIDELVRKTFLNIILIEDDDLKSILFSSRPLQSLRDILLQRISSSQISPYQTDGPAITTFYGRNRELRKILGTTGRSFAVVGARKIGKSSLLARIKSELDNLGAYSIFMDLESPVNPDHASFLQRIEIELDHLFHLNPSFHNNIDLFSNTLKTILNPNKKLIVILDEIDGLLMFDKENDYPLIRSFRSLFQEGYCQFILAGFEVLQNMKRDIHSPLYNFCEEIQLGPLEKKYAVDLITEPMANIGIRYENALDKELIMEYTSCHPNLIQFFCKQLIEHLEEDPDSPGKRIVFRSDILNLFNFEYENYVIDGFYMFYSDMDDLEKLIVLLLIKDYPFKPGISLKMINQLLMNKKISLHERLLFKTLQKLILRFIIWDKGKGIYDFALPHFPSMLRNRVEKELVDSLANRVKKGNFESQH